MSHLQLACNKHYPGKSDLRPSVSHYNFHVIRIIPVGQISFLQCHTYNLHVIKIIPRGSDLRPSLSHLQLACNKNHPRGSDQISVLQCHTYNLHVVSIIPVGQIRSAVLQCHTYNLHVVSIIPVGQIRSPSFSVTLTTCM